MALLRAEPVEKFRGLVNLMGQNLHDSQIEGHRALVISIEARFANHASSARRPLLGGYSGIVVTG